MQIKTTNAYQKWISSINDLRTKLKIEARIRRIETDGFFGQFRVIDSTVSELKIDFGAGYRIYYTKINNTVVILLCGGDKSTQKRDITRAKQLAKEVHNEKAD